MTHDHTTVLQLLLKQEDVELDVKGGAFKQTALHSAILAGTFAAVEMLLSKGASTKVQDKNGHDAMAVAIQNVIGTPVEEHINMMNLLIQAGDKPWPRTGNRCTLLTACKRTHTGLMEDLLASGLDPNTKRKGRPILQEAIACGNMPIVKLLTQKGAFADAKNEKGEDAITYAKCKGSLEIAKYIEDEGNFESRKNRPSSDGLEKQPMPGYCRLRNFDSSKCPRSKSVLATSSCSGIICFIYFILFFKKGKAHVNEWERMNIKKHAPIEKQKRELD